MSQASVKTFVFMMLTVVSVALAASKKEKAKAPESQSQVLQKAQSYLIEDKRREALRLLLRAISTEKSKSSKPYKVFLKNLNNYGGLFLSDRAQQLFESGRIFRKTNSTQAVQILLEALRLDPGNTKIILELGQVYLDAGDCAKADELIKTEQASLEIQKIELIEDLGVLYSGLLLCQKKFKEYEEYRQKKDELKKK